MKKFILLLFVLSGCAVMTPLHKSKLIAAFHLIEIKNFEEAKKVVEEMTLDPRASQWARTWYARGLLCQVAYQDGLRTNDIKKYELYPNQLYEAYASFEKARTLDKSARLERTLSPRYVILANDLQKMGENHFKGSRHAEALKAFELALNITRSSILDIETDNNLLYNTAMAAVESKNHEKAVKYLSELNELKYSTNVLHLLYSTYVDKGDSLAAERVLIENLSHYEDNENMVLLLVDVLYKKNEPQKAIKVLENTSKEKPNKAIFHYTRGLIYQKIEQYPEAIAAYEDAVRLAPNDVMTFARIATCYYNMGVEIEEGMVRITNNRRLLEERTKAEAAFNSAIQWLDKAYDKQPDNPAVISLLYQLYRSLSVNEKARNMQGLMNW
jgi:tetratricopeptide (TPR) repeat protein